MLSRLRDLLIESIPGVLITVVGVRGSVPRGVGTAMLVTQSSIFGTIGGGRLEYVAIHAARKQLRNSDSAITRERYPLGEALGQCCGGAVELLYEPFQSTWVDWVELALEALRSRQIFERKVDAHFTHHLRPPMGHLVLCGAGHVGREVVRVLSNAPISIHWLDEREHEFPSNIPANVNVEVTDTAQSAVANAPRHSGLLVTTHRHDLDFEITTRGLLRKDFSYCGMIGSLSKRKRFERQWRQRERDEDALNRLICPIGSAGPHGKEPAVVAIAVAGEILKTFYAISGGAILKPPIDD